MSSRLERLGGNTAMNDLGAATALRLQRPSWKDPRLLLGILLVLASVAGVVGLVRAAETSTVLYAAKEDISVGQTVSLDQLVSVEARLGSAEGRYIREGEIPLGRIALQRVAKGDLVPASILGAPESLDRSPVSINVQEPLPAEVVPGSRVDIWIAPPDGRNGFAEPRLAIPAAEVSHLQAEAAGLGGPRETVVHVLVGSERLPQLLGAQANKARISVVWNPSGRAR